LDAATRRAETLLASRSEGAARIKAAKAMSETDKREPRHTPACSRVARLGWFAALYLASLAAFAALVYGFRAIVPR
jgi:hypothetical protein